ncbi:hypothetical protein EIJ12_13195 [Xanthomonas perforans]|uniref:Uncharacterized protein n=1 Tax=Xanthomonas perforans TaxID=442694 RepID=A0AAQ1BV99_XANPE|nr:hypothetical protein XPE_10505 [Xanthomonas perforans 91-118]PWH23047.1 hypothetical protein CDO09_14295 [Xanthomonas perforans]RXD34369.1 hypothetical protein DB854_17620 [Xanthomonas perforans]RXD35424.1 hypothetical protein DB757_21655 [Xanthomonas perforans]RXD51337.1 hypothetical protein DB769_17065 [Xanthomonas perforans]
MRLQSAQRNFSIFRIRTILNSSYYLMYDLVALIFIQFLKHLPAIYMRQATVHQKGSKAWKASL